MELLWPETFSMDCLCATVIRPRSRRSWDSVEIRDRILFGHIIMFSSFRKNLETKEEIFGTLPWRFIHKGACGEASCSRCFADFIKFRMAGRITFTHWVRRGTMKSGTIKGWKPNCFDVLNLVVRTDADSNMASPIATVAEARPWTRPWTAPDRKPEKMSSKILSYTHTENDLDKKHDDI